FEDYREINCTGRTLILISRLFCVDFAGREFSKSRKTSQFRGPKHFALRFVVDSLPLVYAPNILYVLFLFSLMNILFLILFLSVMRSIKITMLIILFTVSLTRNLSLMDELNMLVLLCGLMRSGSRISKVFLRVSV
ncbi:hypothetical protein H5410_036381, partial [Solanum commersonii]